MSSDSRDQAMVQTLTPKSSLATNRQMLAALGLRVDIPGGVVAQVNALFPVTSGAGLRPQPMAVFSLTKRY